MDFVAIDVETANCDIASICQIGIAKCRDGRIVEEWSTYIDPEDYFDSVNISIHGINELTVQGAPTFPEIFDLLKDHVADSVLVCHTHFDRASVSRASVKYSHPSVPWKWLDSARVARRTWTEFAYRGYGLAEVCRHIGYEFRHHDALEDAKACAHIMLAAIKKSEFTASEWLSRVTKPIFQSSYSSPSQSVSRDGNPDGPLFGETVVFTGKLSLPRGLMANLASELGCSVANDVTKRTSILVVGDQDVRVLNGHEKSSKHRKAEDFISKGQAIRILGETDFQELSRLAVNQSPE